jgi:hypothetical protein
MYTVPSDPGDLARFPMARIHVSFNGGSVPIVVGDTPPDLETPIAEPTDTGFLTNQTAIVVEGEYCVGLQTEQPYAPLWQVVRAFDGERADIAFRILP